ncbi:MAG TPA: DUF2505 domain-containing protein [Polyangiaceae bacterium]
MAESRIEHLINCTEDTFWKVFFDPEFNRQLFYDVLGFDSWKVVRSDETDTRIDRVVDVVPKVGDLPGPLKKLVEGGIGYRETGVFDKAQKRLRITVEPSTLQGKLQISGVQYTQPAGEGTCRRVYESTAVAKIFGVGGMIENRILAEVKTSYDKAAEFTNRWIKEKGL